MAMRETRKLKYLCYILDEYRKPISAEKETKTQICYMITMVRRVLLTKSMDTQ